MVRRWSLVTVALVVLIGRTPPSDAKFVVNKCCPPNEAYLENGKCSALNKTEDGSPHEFKVPKLVTDSQVVDFYSKDLYTLRYGKPICNDSFILFPNIESDESFSINEEGHLLANGKPYLSTEYKYCFEQRLNDETLYYMAVVCSLTNSLCDPDISNCPCLPEQTYQENKSCPPPSSLSTLTWPQICMLISLPFLVLTFIVYALNHELQDLHGKSLMCHVASLFLAYSVFIYNQYLTSTMKELGDHPILCLWIAYIQQFAFIATFFWLNVMCFEIWKNFRQLRVSTEEGEKKKFIIYSIYAWGCTILISLITFIMEFFKTSDLRPKFGYAGTCWFDSTKSKLFYFYGPIGILLFSNLLMFIHSIIIIIKQTKYAKVFNGSESRKEEQEKGNIKFKLFLSLFIIMGLNWVAEIIIWITNASGDFWTVLNIGNGLQGFLIFIIFVCNKPVLRLLNRKLFPQFQLIKPAGVSTRNNVDNTDVQLEI